MKFPLLTGRLAIIPLTWADIPAFVAYRQDPQTARYQSWDTEYSVADAEALVAAQPPSEFPGAGEWLQLGLHATAEPGGAPALVGDVAIGADSVQPDTFELGVTLRPESRGMGYATEALTVVISVLMRERGAHRVVMQGDARNAAVLALARGLGFRHEGAIVEGDWFKGEWSTLERFALLNREWMAR